MPINANSVPVDKDCVGERWIVNGEEHLAKVIALIAVAQQLHAAQIVRELRPVEPIFKNINVFKAARHRISSTGKNDKAIEQRDGLLFEAISWISALKTSCDNTLMTAPHLSSTTQGIDGLILELAEGIPEIRWATIREDKCSQNPRKIFQSQVLKTFRSHHIGERAPELVASAADLLDKVIRDASQANKAAEKVLDLGARKYRAALTIEHKDDSPSRLKAIFKDFDSLEDVNQEQRVAAVFVVDDDLRVYFERLSQVVIAAIDKWEKEGICNV